jgi:hypothetical protein
VSQRGEEERGARIGSLFAWPSGARKEFEVKDAPVARRGTLIRPFGPPPGRLPGGRLFSRIGRRKTPVSRRAFAAEGSP